MCFVEKEVDLCTSSEIHGTVTYHTIGLLPSSPPFSNLQVTVTEKKNTVSVSNL